MKLEPDEDPHYDEIGVRTIELSDVRIDSTTEAFATVEMPVEIGSNKTCDSQVQG